MSFITGKIFLNWNWSKFLITFFFVTLSMDINPSMSLIKSTILQFLPGASIVLFGSRARGEAGKDSDVDLLIITDDLLDIRARMAMEKKIRQELTARYKLPFDIILQNKSVAAEKKKLLGHIVYYAMKEGILL